MVGLWPRPQLDSKNGLGLPMNLLMKTANMSRSEPMAPMSANRRRSHVRTVGRTVAISVVVSELITVVLMRLLLGEILPEGLIIALVCSAPISAWIADRQLRMSYVISHQRDQLSRLNDELESRNADLDAFASTVAHDLKNPLATIIGMADVLLDDPKISCRAESKEFAAAILQSGEHAAEIIEGLLLLHGLQHETRVLEPVDTNATIDAALKTMTQTIEDSDAVVRRSGTMLSVRGYGPWLTQVWINLIGNAIKYGGSPPTVEVAARATRDGMVRFEVKDNGRGIEADDQDRIFREFERVESNEEGHGLGLAIVDRVVTRLDGTTGIDDAEGGGSVFWFTVPAA